MIDISKLTEADKGREVLYRVPRFKQYGYISSWNSRFIFVDYRLKVLTSMAGLEGTRIALQGDTIKATRPEDLEWA